MTYAPRAMPWAISIRSPSGSKTIEANKKILTIEAATAAGKPITHIDSSRQKLA